MRWFLLLLLAVVSSANAHIGSPNVFFEGAAGPYPARVIVKPPGVVPGLAEIHVRVLTGVVDRVTALPVYARAGKKGAPPPDVAKPVRGETNLFTTELWLMKSGAYSVEVTAEGPQGKGTVIVPVNSVAMTRNAMPRWFAVMLGSLGILLFLSAAKLIGSAFGESVLDPAAEITRKVRWRSRLGAMAGAIFFGLILWGGKLWWDYEDREYRHERLYLRTPVNASIAWKKGQPILELAFRPERRRDWTPLIPDHGKLMHLFILREPELDVFGHLHPQQVSPNLFASALPAFPPGSYQLYADVTHENGFSETLTASLALPELPAFYAALWQSAGEVICSTATVLSRSTNFALAPDPDDSWHILSADGGPSTSRVTGGQNMVWENAGTLRAGSEVSLRFKLLDAQGSPASIEPYMGMLGHAAVRRKDGAVFAHLHPSGTFSMASQQFFLNDGQLKAFSTVPHTNHVAGGASSVSSVAFPYEFPQPGAYRIWVQLRSAGRVLTGAFDAEIQPRGRR